MYVVLIQYCCWRQQYMINIVIIAVFIQRDINAWISYQKDVKFTYECRSNLSVLNVQSIWSFCYQKGN